MDRIWVWWLRRGLLKLLAQRRVDLEVQRVWWAARGVQLGEWDPSPLDLLYGLVNGLHQPDSRPWRQQVEALTLIDKIWVVTRESEFGRILASSSDTSGSLSVES